MCEQLVAEIPEGDYRPDILVTNIENALNNQSCLSGEPL